LECDVYIEIPKAGPMREAYLGDRAWSPLAMAVAAGLTEGVGRRVVVPLGEWPSQRIGGLPDAWRGRVELVGDIDEPDVKDREVSSRLRNWVPTGGLHGPLMTTEFCTYANPAEVLKGLGKECATFALVFSGRHGFLTPSGAQQMASSASRAGWNEAVYFADGPQGLIPAVWSREALEHLREHGRVAQSLISGRRFWGSKFLHMPTEVIRCRRSFLLTTTKGRAFCSAVAQRLKELGFSLNPITDARAMPSMQDVCAAGDALGEAWLGDLPWDLEVEVTTRRPFDPLWLPRQRVSPDMSLASFQGLVESLGPMADSVCLTIGGEGDPLLHPELDGMIRFASGRVRGVALRTFGAGLTDSRLDALLALPLDTLTVRLGAYGERAYKAANGIGGFDQLWQTLVDGRLRQGTGDDPQILPLIVPEVVKTQVGEDTVIDFYLHARDASLWPMVAPPMTYCGSVAPHGTIEQYPGRRYACVRLSNQMLVLADGSVPMCSQSTPTDVRAANALLTGVPAAWRSAALNAARSAHAKGDWQAAIPACGTCNQWHQLC